MRLYDLYVRFIKKKPAQSPSAQAPTTQSDLDKTLLEFRGANGSKHPWTLRDSLMGTQIFGASGSGKSSGSGRALAEAFLSNGFGGLVLCAKPDEAIQWQDYAAQCGRSKDLVIFKEGMNLGFDPLLYESKRKTKGGGETLNMVDLIMNIHEMGQGFMSGSTGGESERFWDNSLRRAVSRAIDLLMMMGEDVTIANMRELVLSSDQEYDINTYKERVALIQDAPQGDPDRQILINSLTDIMDRNYCIRLLHKARIDGGRTPRITVEKFQFLQSYYMKEYHGLSERTKSSIREMFLGLVEPFMSGILKKHFTGQVSSQIAPENTYMHGKIVVLDFSVKEYMVSGIYAQAMYKFIWQMAMERRDIKANDRPVFLWADESQYFVNPKHDTLFQTTARSARVATAYLTQNMNNYYFMMGDKGGAAKAKSLIGNLGTKIFHANSDHDTNLFAANMIGQSEQSKRSVSYGDSSASTSEQSSVELQVLPSAFTILETGGVSRKVDAMIVQTGRKWGNENYLHATFKQKKI